MQPALTNLLPQERVRGLRRAYFLRLATVGVLLLVGVVVAHAALLVPSYLYANLQVKDRANQLAALDAQLARSEEREVESRIESLRTNSAYLARLDTAPAGSTAVVALLKVSRPGISLTGFGYEASATSGAPARMTISGTADTRESLRTYDQALAALPFVSSADLPISAYAKESQIPFTITLTGTLTP